MKRLSKANSVYMIYMLFIIYIFFSSDIVFAKEKSNVEGEARASTNGSENDSDVEKKFYSITTTDGSKYYLIVDEAAGSNNVYFLKEVSTSDLEPLAETDNQVSTDSIANQIKSVVSVKDEAEEVIEETSITATPDTVATTDPIPSATESNDKQSASTKSKSKLSFIPIVVGVIGAVIFLFIKKRKSTNTNEKDDEVVDDEIELCSSSSEKDLNNGELEVSEIDDEIIL